MSKRLGLLFLMALSFSFLGLSQNSSYELNISGVSSNQKYGYSESKPICVGSIKNEYIFMKMLRAPDGNELKWSRIGSCCEFRSSSAPLGSGFLDVFTVVFPDGTEKTIYLNGYEYSKPKCPYGFAFIKNGDLITQ